MVGEASRSHRDLLVCAKYNCFLDLVAYNTIKRSCNPDMYQDSFESSPGSATSTLPFSYMVPCLWWSALEAPGQSRNCESICCFACLASPSLFLFYFFFAVAIDSPKSSYKGSGGQVSSSRTQGPTNLPSWPLHGAPFPLNPRLKSNILGGWMRSNKA